MATKATKATKAASSTTPPIPPYPLRSLTIAERVAISELIAAAGILGSAHRNKPNLQVAAAGAMLIERAAMLIRGESACFCLTREGIQEFADFWRVCEQGALTRQARATRAVRKGTRR